MGKASDINIAIIGGDLRQRLVADELKKCGYKVSEYAVNGEEPVAELSQTVKDADIAVLPLPASRDGFHVNSQANIRFDVLADYLPYGCRIFAGRLQPSLKDMLSGRVFEIFDFY